MNIGHSRALQLLNYHHTGHGSTLPKDKIYPLSIPEHKTMLEYIEEAFKQNSIRPFTFHAVLSFFFVNKKDGGLQLFIDYHTLTSQMVKYHYPLPLVPAALQLLRGARIFTKLDLRSIYNHQGTINIL